MNAWSWYWTCWAVGSLGVGFLVPECIALFSRHSENTLSAQIWRMEGVIPGHSVPLSMWSAGHVLLGGMLTLLFLWLIFHFLLGWFA